MKKNSMKIGLLALFVASCAGLVCCSQEEQNASGKSEDLQIAYAELSQQLAIYDANFKEEYGIPETRGFFKKLLGALLADASGALIGSSAGPVGAIFGAIFNSAVAGPAIGEELEATTYITTRPDMAHVTDSGSCSASTSDKTTSTTVEGDPTSASTESAPVAVSATGIGYLHNLILTEIEIENPGIYNQGTSLEALGNLIVEKMKKYGYSISESDKRALMNKSDKVVPKQVYTTEDELVSHYRNVLPEFAPEMRVIQNFACNVEAISNDSELVKAYANGFEKVISASSLPESAKADLLPCIEVAANSAVLWEVQSASLPDEP